MSRFCKKIFTKVCLAAGLCAVLSACAESEWPQWLSGEPSRVELNSYTGPIDMPPLSAEGKEWPNLADVPERPVLPEQPAQAQALKDELKAKNAEGQKMVEAFKSESIKPPAKAPKPPAKKTGKKKKKATR